LYGRKNMNPVSRFVHEIPEDLIDGMEQSKAERFGLFSRLKAKPSPSTSPLKRKELKMKTTTGAENETWGPGDKAANKKWGVGTVVKVQGEGEAMELDIAFPAPTGIKRVLAKFAPITKE